MLWYRDDFAAEPLDALMRRLQSAVPAGGGLELPIETTSSATWRPVPIHSWRSRYRNQNTSTVTGTIHQARKIAAPFSRRDNRGRSPFKSVKWARTSPLKSQG